MTQKEVPVPVPRPRPNRGFSLAEVMVAILVLLVIAAIAIPLMLNSKNRAYRQTAILDGQAAATEVGELLATYTSFGTSPTGFTTVPTGGAGAGTLTITLGTGYTPSSNTSTKTGTLTLTSGSVLTGALQSGGTNWCVKVTNKSQIAVYTQSGFETTATTCTSSGTDLAGRPWG